MQLPPTTFFAPKRPHDEDESVIVEEEGEKISDELDADSFLTQTARNLPSTLLAWHYRSRYESLISFSNAAFYSGDLLQCPNRQLPIADRSDADRSNLVRRQPNSWPHSSPAPSAFTS